MSIPTITVNGTFRDAAGDPMSGTLTFRLNAPLVDSVGNIVSERKEIVSTLNASGQITDTNGSTVGLVLYCTSGGDIAPAGLLYDVKVEVGSRPRKVSVAVPSSLGASVDWADLVPVPSSTGVVWTVPDLTEEQARDLVGSTLAEGQGIDITVDDVANTVTIAAEVTQAELDTVSGLIPSTEAIQDIVGGMVSGGTETGIAVSYDDTNGRLDFVAEVTQAELDALSGTYVPQDLSTLTASSAPDTDDLIYVWLDGAPRKVTLADIETLIGGGGGGGTVDVVSNVAQDRILGRVTAGSGDSEELTAAQVKTLLALVKGDVGLGNVDNTADANKPVSTAQQTALNLKANAANPVFTGTVTIPDGALAIADTNGLQAALDAKLPADLSTLTASTSPDTDDEIVVWLDGALRRVPLSNVLALGGGGGTVDVVSNVAADRILGRVTGGSGDSEELTAAQVKTLLAIAAADISDASANGRSLITAADYAAMRTLLGVALASTRSRSLDEEAADIQAINTTTETTVGTLTLPTNLVAGDVLRFGFYGRILNSSGATVTYLFRLKLGATTVWTSNAASYASSAQERKFAMHGDILIVNPANAQRLGGRVGVANASASNPNIGGAGVLGEAYGAATEDLTSAKNLVLTVEMGTAAAAADFTTKMANLSVVTR